MRVRESIYTALGYKVTYVKVPKFRGVEHVELCLAEKGGATFYAFNDQKGRYVKIMKIQQSVPYMARFSEPKNGHILMEKASGELLWNLDTIPDQPVLEAALIRFAEATKAQHLSHGDIRPWNVFQDENGKITVIDWHLSHFLNTDQDHDLDLRDARKFIQLLNREISFVEAWAHERPQYPSWCRPS